jgi:hypothetical protein
MGRHESGNLYASLDGGSEGSIASGTSVAIFPGGAGVVLGGGSGTGTFNGRISELVVYNIALTGTDLSDAIASLMAKL